jgi:hypothetical protein
MIIVEAVREKCENKKNFAKRNSTLLVLKSELLLQLQLDENFMGIMRGRIFSVCAKVMTMMKTRILIK